MADTLNDKIRKMRIRREQTQKQIIDEAGMMHTSNRFVNKSKVTSGDFDRAQKNHEENQKLQKNAASMSPEQKTAAFAAARKAASDEAAKAAAEYNAKKKLKEDHMMFSDKKLGVDESILDAVKKARGFGKIEFDNEKRRLQEEAKKLKEEVEQVDELSKRTMGSYVKKAIDDIGGAGVGIGRATSKSGSAEEYASSQRMYTKRAKGIRKAVDKLAKEEVEQVDELSDKTLQSYREKSHKDSKPRSWGRKTAFAKQTGIGAKVKATKEEVESEGEQVDELSKKTLGSYVKKSAADAVMSGAEVGKTFDRDRRLPGAMDVRNKEKRNVRNRLNGIMRATNKLAKEDVEVNESENADVSKDKYVTRVTKQGLKMKNRGSIIFNHDTRKSIADLENEQHHVFSDDTGLKWKAHRQGSYVHFKPHTQHTALTHGTSSWVVGHSDLKEEVEQVDELSRKTLSSYVKKSSESSNQAWFDLGKNKTKTINDKDNVKHIDKAIKRQKGMDIASKKLAKEEVEQVDEASRGRGRPKLPRDKDGKVIRDPQVLAKMKASGDHEDGGVEHFIVQLRKVINLRGNYDVTYRDGHKGRIPTAVAHRALQVHDNLKTAAEKSNFTHRISKSVSSFQDALAGKKEEKHDGKPSLPKITALSK